MIHEDRPPEQERDLGEFMSRTAERPGDSCSASSDCDYERAAAYQEILRLRRVAAWAAAQLPDDMLRITEVLTEERPTREMFFAALPDWDFEVKGGTFEEPRWAYEEHPWYQQLGITEEECVEFWNRRNAVD